MLPRQRIDAISLPKDGTATIVLDDNPAPVLRFPRARHTEPRLPRDPTTGRPVWQGVPVPYVTRWTGEVYDLSLIHLYFRDELIVCYSDPSLNTFGMRAGLRADRDEMGILWYKEAPGRAGWGDPVFRDVHCGRQRECMIDKVCQVCGAPFGDTTVTFLTTRVPARGKGGPLVTSRAPACRRCIDVTLANCPPQMRKPRSIIHARSYRPDSVIADVLPGDPQVRNPQTTRVDLELDDERLLRAVAKQMYVCITDYDDEPVGPSSTTIIPMGTGAPALSGDVATPTRSAKEEHPMSETTPVPTPPAERPAAELATMVDLMALLPTNGVPDLPWQARMYRAQGAAEAAMLAALVFDSRRRRPVVVTTLTKRGPIRTQFNPRTLATRLWGVADVVVVPDRETVAALCAGLPKWLEVYNGQSRLFMPAADLSDEGARHPVNPGNAKQADMERLITHHINTTPIVDPHQELATTQTALHKTQADLREAKDQLRNATDDDDQDGPYAQVYADREAQFEHDLWLTWLRTVPEYERDRWPLRDYTLGPEFLDSLDKQEQNISRARILRCVVDILTERYREQNGREAKRQRDDVTGSSTGNAAITREDGAQAWRCAVSKKTANANRVMWWECEQKEVELSRVVSHDDYRMV